MNASDSKARTSPHPTPASAGLDAIAIVGPTASGKTALAIELAQRLDTEIISADSMQFYRGMEIGTAAPTPEELAAVRHHFVSFLDPDEPYSAGAFARDARAVVENLLQRERIAVVVGGSGLYVSALLEGLFEGPARDESIRDRLMREAQIEGVPALYDRLKSVDPVYAQAILPNDLRRIVRALEVFEITGRAISDFHRDHRRQTESLRALFVGIEHERADLYARINTRVDRMMEAGFVDEVRRLLDAGYGNAIERLKSLGYREVAAYLRGEQSLDAAVERIKMNTRHFAKRQLSWYRGDDRVRWLPVTAYLTPSAQADVVLGWLRD